MNDAGLNLDRQWAASTVAWHNDKLVITHELDYPREIVAVDKMMHALVKTDELLFEAGRNRYRSTPIRISELGRKFFELPPD